MMFAKYQRHACFNIRVAAQRKRADVGQKGAYRHDGRMERFKRIPARCYKHSART
jgi:hypothetical protein